MSNGIIVASSVRLSADSFTYKVGTSIAVMENVSLGFTTA